MAAALRRDDGCAGLGRLNSGSSPRRRRRHQFGIPSAGVVPNRAGAFASPATLEAMPRTLTIGIEDCDEETYSRVANAVWYAVNASGVNFSVAPDDDADRESLNADWREQEPWT